jgi:AraC-like DNA-binding protein
MLLYETKKSVTDIAFEVGFGSYSNFYRTFMRITGISPRDYQSRESLLRENEE